jgi:hypothetical protein
MPQVQRIADQPDAHHQRIRQQVPIEHPLWPRRDAARRAQHRQQRPPARKRLVRADRRQRQHDQPHPQHRLHMAAPRGLHGSSIAQPHARQDPARHQLPEARQRRIERRRAKRMDRQHVDQERHHRQRPQHAQHRPAPTPRQRQERRPEDVELLLDPQRPQVQQRLGLRRRVEVPRLAPEHEVRDEGRPARGLLAQLHELAVQQHVPAEGQGCRQHQHQRREDAPHAPCVEVAVAEVARRLALKNDGRDQEARDHEEEVHPHETAGQRLREGVVRHHRGHGHGAQAIDVGAVLGMHRCAFRQSFQLPARGGAGARNAVST